MLYFLCVAFLVGTICYIEIPGVFDNKNLLTGYITPDNHLLIFSRNNSGNISLYKYEIDSDSILYTKYNKLELVPFPLNVSETITNIHFGFEYINSTIINFTVF